MRSVQLGEKEVEFQPPFIDVGTLEFSVVARDGFECQGDPPGINVFQFRCFRKVYQTWKWPLCEGLLIVQMRVQGKHTREGI
jgi:hypothetical protein